MLALLGVAFAGSLAGVTVPDRTSLAGQELVLNGMGLREAYFIDIYVGSLYLPAKTSSADEAIQQDVPKRIQMDFVYREVTTEQMLGTFQDGLARNPHAEALARYMDQIAGMLEPVRAGDAVLIDYAPGVGTSFTLKGKGKGTIPGTDFMRAIWTIYLGPYPPTPALKLGMLGLG